MQAAQTPPITDTDILNLALQLEYLEANYYSFATTGERCSRMTNPSLVPAFGAGRADYAMLHSLVDALIVCLRRVAGQPIPTTLIGGGPGAIGGPAVVFQNETVNSIAKEIAKDELNQCALAEWVPS